MILGILFGLILAFSAAFALVYGKVNKSVVSGDSKGSFQDFTKTPLFIEEQKDHVNKDYPIG